MGHSLLVIWQTEGLWLFGDDPNQWEFVCPNCGLVQRPQDFLDMGMTQKMTDTYAGFTCIARWRGGPCRATNIGPINLIITSAEPSRPTFDWNKP